MIEEAAPAKINLALHVTGQREDGYHLLDTLVTFAEAGDKISLVAAKEDGFGMSGRFCHDLPTDSSSTGNLVLRARDLLRAYATAAGHEALPVHIHLQKNLPVASGIGGGSADAAATLRGLCRFWDLTIARQDLRDLALKIGADVPMCLESKALVARGIGEEIRILSDFPSLHLLLVNPLAHVSTPVIFKSLTHKNNPPLALPEDRAATEDWLSALIGARNDLQPPAEILEPKIIEALGLISATAPVFARMSGSGATCFGLYATEAQCAAARAALEAVKPDWYIEATRSL